MRNETRLALKLFVLKAHRLRDGRFVQFLQEQGGTKLKMAMHRGQDGDNDTVTVEHQRPDDDATDAFVLNFRFFIHSTERSSFRWLANHALDDPELSAEWKRAFTSARDEVNSFLDAQSHFVERVMGPPPKGSTEEPRLVEEQHLTNREIMDIFINGGMAHAELPKWETFERWKRNQLGFPYMQHEFDTIIVTVLNAIAFVCAWCEKELVAISAEAQPQGE